MSVEAFRVAWLMYFLGVLGAVAAAIIAFLILEFMAILNNQAGDTLTEITRAVLDHPFSPWWILYLTGLVFIVTVIGWLGPHMLGMGKIW